MEGQPELCLKRLAYLISSRTAQSAERSRVRVASVERNHSARVPGRARRDRGPGRSNGDSPGAGARGIAPPVLRPAR